MTKERPEGYIIPDTCVHCKHVGIVGKLSPIGYQKYKCKKHNLPVSEFGWCPTFEDDT